MPTFTYPYDTASDYTYNSTKISVSGGKASLRENFTDVYARWHLNQSSGTNCPDDSGNGRHGTGQNIEDGDWVAGKLNNCLNLDGTNEYVDCGAIASFERTVPFSASAWIKTSDTTSTDINIITKGGGAAAGWAFTYHPSAGSIEVNLVNTAATNLITVRVTGIGGTLSDGNWHHIVFTYSGSSAASGVKIYIDGVDQTTTTIDDTLSATIISATNCQIGAQAGSNTWNGYVDEVIIWSVAISGANVTYIYNSGTGQEDWYYWNDNPTIEPTNLLVPGYVTDWSNFAETLGGGNEGTVAYNLYRNTKLSKFYWTGSAWSTGGSASNSNSAAIVDTNIDVLDVAPEGIGFVAYLKSDGTQKVELDLNSITYVQASASIQPTDIHLYESVDMTDDLTSGGIMSDVQIACGTMNNIFPNISRLDRLYGRVQFRKIYIKIDSDNLDTYSGAHVAIKEIPFDPNVSMVFLRSSGVTEDRNDLMPTIEEFYEVGGIAGDAQCYSAVPVDSEMITFQLDQINMVYTFVGRY